MPALASARHGAHLAAFDAIEANSMLELEPPVHTLRLAGEPLSRYLEALVVRD